MTVEPASETSRRSREQPHDFMPDDEALPRGPTARTVLLAATALTTLALAMLVVPDLRVQETLRGFLDRLVALGPWAPPAFVAMYVVGSVLLLPASPLTIGAGFVMGLSLGFPLALTASTLGAICAFLVGRYGARRHVREWLATHPRFAAVDRAVAARGWQVVLLFRLAPSLPFHVLNYMFGITGVRLRHFVIATFVGRIPVTATHVYLGSVAREMTDVGAALESRSSLEWALFVGGLIVSLLGAAYLSRLARQALAETPGESAPHSLLPPGVAH